MKSVHDILLDINLSTRDVKTIPVKDDYRKHYLGGKGLALRVLYDYIEPGIDPLSSQNVIAFMTGPLSGTGAPSTDKFVVVTKSPLTGIMASSSCGGSFGYKLKRAGYDGLIVRGASETPVYVSVSNERVEIFKADAMWGLTTKDTQTKIARSEEGCVVIGPAGENLVRYACIRSDDRFAGRCGTGAVMGSKKLKGIVINGNTACKVADPNRMRETVRICKERISISPVTGGTLSYLGTPSWVNLCNEFNILPTKNFTMGRFEKAEQISGEFIREHYFHSNAGCHGCSVRCGRNLQLRGRQYRCPEYAGIAALGSNLLIGDVEEVIELNELCNELGLDVISTGNVLGLVMELQEKGLLTYRAEFGDPQSAKDIIYQIAFREGLGQELGQGVQWFSEKNGYQEYALHIKGLEMTTHDPRGIFGDALAYATANRGACHLSGNTFATDLIYGLLDPLSSQGKPEWVRFTQDAMDFVNSMIICSFITMPLFMEDPVAKKIPLSVKKFFSRTFPELSLKFSSIDIFLNLLSSALGGHFTKKECLDVGERTFNLERLMNVREGISSKDDTIPQRMLQEPLSNNGTIQIPIQQMIKRYYKLRQWDANGIPTKAKLTQLSIPH
jgi:aldehyde:ferredoxin oxidoreductase